MARILFFGRLSDIAQNMTVMLPETVTDTQRLQQWLAEEHEGFSEALNRPGTRIAINKNIINSVHPVSDRDEIAFMSALSGG